MPNLLNNLFRVEANFAIFLNKIFLRCNFNILTTAGAEQHVFLREYKFVNLLCKGSGILEIFE